jgi:hypothetical protein
MAQQERRRSDPIAGAPGWAPADTDDKTTARALEATSE